MIIALSFVEIIQVTHTDGLKRVICGFAYGFCAFHHAASQEVNNPSSYVQLWRPFFGVIKSFTDVSKFFRSSYQLNVRFRRNLDQVIDGLIRLELTDLHWPLLPIAIVSVNAIFEER